MSNLPWAQILAWLLAAFFLFGGSVNVRAPEKVAADYRRWGYPDWFHFVTGSLEVATAVLLAIAATRPWGAMLGAGVMFAAVATVTFHREYSHAIPPLVFLVLSIVAGWANWQP